jgi:hypothetical protein
MTFLLLYHAIVDYIELKMKWRYMVVAWHIVTPEK